MILSVGVILETYALMVETLLKALARSPIFFKQGWKVLVVDFSSDRRGSVAVLFALAVVMIF